MTIVDRIKKREEKEKEEVIDLLREQMKVEGQLVGLYERTAPDIKNNPVRSLLHMIQLDSRKHIEICKLAIEVLEGEEVFSEDKTELIGGLRDHVELEKGSIDRANEMLKNVWISENQALSEMIKKLRDDERRHHETLKKLSEKPFFRFDPRDFTVIMRGFEFAEERYRRSKEFRERNKQPDTKET